MLRAEEEGTEQVTTGTRARTADASKLTTPQGRPSGAGQSSTEQSRAEQKTRAEQPQRQRIDSERVGQAKPKMRLLLVVAALAAVAAAVGAPIGLAGSSEAPRPHIVMILVDDFGFNDVSYHRPSRDSQEGSAEIHTPTLAGLARSGIELNRHYTYNYCSPSRSSLQSGRLPVHVSVDNTDPLSVNPDDPVSGFSGIPTKMTGIAEKLRAAGYRTHMTGKWDAGMADYAQTPMGKGYESWLGYYHHANDYWDASLSGGSTVHPDLCYKRGQKLVDLWSTESASGGARHLNGTKYEEYLFTENSLKVIAAHDASKADAPLFLFHSFHTVHTPLQIPKEREQRFSFLRNQDRRRYAAMVEYMDESVGQLVAALQRKGMWDNTLLVLSSDNGGPIYGSVISPTGLNRAFGAASNTPLRGGKTSDWEGGVRVNALVSGGAVPVGRRGTVLQDYVHIADWYATFCALAGVDAHDERAENADLPPVDSVNMWPLLSGAVALGEGPRTEIHLSRKTLIQGPWKLLTGSDNAIFNFWGDDEAHMTFDVHANGWGLPAIKNTLSRGRNCEAGCLFNIAEDEAEDNELAAEHPDIVEKMMARLKELNKGNFNPDRGTPTTLGCDVAVEKYGGFYGPFINIGGPTLTKQQHREAMFDRADLEHLNSRENMLLDAIFRS